MPGEDQKKYKKNVIPQFQGTQKNGLAMWQKFTTIVEQNNQWKQRQKIGTLSCKWQPKILISGTR